MRTVTPKRGLIAVQREYIVHFKPLYLISLEIITWQTSAHFMLSPLYPRSTAIVYEYTSRDCYNSWTPPRSSFLCWYIIHDVCDHVIWAASRNPFSTSIESRNYSTSTRIASRKYFLFRFSFNKTFCKSGKFTDRVGTILGDVVSRILLRIEVKSIGTNRWCFRVQSSKNVHSLPKIYCFLLITFFNRLWCRV